MASSLLNSSNSGSSFNVSIPSKYTSVVLTQTYAAGAYSFTSANGASNMDVYFLNTSTGTTVGYTSTKAITASASFNKIVVLGGSTGDLLQFTFTTTYVASAETSETSAGPVLTGATPTTVANINNTLTVSGYNFASGMSVVFTGTDATPRTAKSVVVGSPTSAIVTRPDALPASYNPYTLSAYNPGVNSPVGSNSYILATPTISAGANPVWVTSSGTLSAQAFYTSPYSYTLSATDADGGSTVTYALASGSLPPGLSLNGTSGAITGTPTNNATTSYSFSVTATDSGGNTATQSFSITNNVAPTVSYLVVGGGGGGGYDAAPGGGAGGLVIGSTSFVNGLITVGAGGTGNSGQGGNSVLTGTTVTVTGYGGGGGGAGAGSNGNAGGSGGGSGYLSGHTGGAATQTSPTGGTGYGNAGGNSPVTVNYSGAGGGGAGGVGANNNSGGQGGAGVASSITGTNLYYAGGGGAGGANNAAGGSGIGGQGATPAAGSTGGAGATNTGSGGGGGGYSGNGGPGGSGIVIISYPNTLPALSNIPGNITYTVNNNVSGNRVYQFTSGSGTVGF